MQLVFGRQSVVPGITDGHHGASGGVGIGSDLNLSIAKRQKNYTERLTSEVIGTKNH